jgi:hypothetical protein
MSLLPDKTELAEIRRALKEAGATAPDAEANAIKAFRDGDVTIDRIDSWMTLQKIDNPTSLWVATNVQVNADEARAEQIAALTRTAFEHGGSPGARGRLVLEIGEDAADKAAKEFGLKGLHDYATKIAAPTADDKGGDDKAKDKAKDKTSNPFTAQAWNLTEQSRLFRVNPELCAKLAAAAGVKIGATRPIK